MENKALVTDDNNIVRDYLHAEDLFAMIGKCVDADRINDVFDVCSLQPVSKQEILEYFVSAYALRYETRPRTTNASATGAKSNYFSTYGQAVGIGFSPGYSSMDTIKLVTEHILPRHKYAMNGNRNHYER